MSRLLFILASFASLAWAQTDIACLDCHSNQGWKPLADVRIFDHSKDTVYPLEFAHADLNCAQCHTGASIEAFHRFTVHGTECGACHQDVHQAFWGNRCEDCHQPDQWSPDMAFRRHEETLFPLMGAHAFTECYLCHSTPHVLPAPECEACHGPDFVVGLPAHEGLTPASDCSMCHGPRNWNDIIAVNHDAFFPIYSGHHRGRWSSCSTCHTAAGDFSTYTCMGSGCHSLSRMNQEHCEDGGCERCDGLTYPSVGVQSEDCYFCHPQGNTSKCGD